MKRVIVSGGGTGGHIFPALSIANALKRLQPDIEILFVGAEGKMEMEKVPEAGYRIEGLPVRGLKRKLTLENVKVLYNLWKSLRKARKIIREFICTCDSQRPGSLSCISCTSGTDIKNLF